MSTWLCIPSARPAEQVEPVLAKWRERGYNIALWRDLGDGFIAGRGDYLIHENREYPGYAEAVNFLAHRVLANDPSCDWIVTGGDDTLPDPNHTAEEIAAQCSDHFLWNNIEASELGDAFQRTMTGEKAKTFGVVQPTGDRFAGGCIDRIAGSPWLGREWCLRANGGHGPFWPEFTHMFGDECLKRTAEKLGVYWTRPDLIHKHMHFQRQSDAIDSNAAPKPVPPHLAEWTTPAHWDEMKAIFKRLEAEDFASCLPK